MAYFPDTIAAATKGNAVQAALMVEIGFQSGIIRLWNGNGTKTTLDSKVWTGLRGLGQITGIEKAINGNAPQAIMSVSGVDPSFDTEEQGDPSDYFNQPATVYLQFFNPDWSCLDEPFAIFGGTMQQLVETFGWDDSIKAWSSLIGVTVESWFTGRGQPPYSFYSDNDQQLRFPGDVGLEYMATLQYYVVRWPTL